MAKASVNKVILVGNLGGDPEISYTQGGQAVTKFNLATTSVRVEKDGSKTEETEWHKIVVWGKQAENCKEFLKKGSLVFIEGSIRTRNFVGKDNVKRYVTEIIAQNVRFLSPSSSREKVPAVQEEDEKVEKVEKEDSIPEFNDDIPF